MANLSIFRLPGLTAWLFLILAFIGGLTTPAQATGWTVTRPELVGLDKTKIDSLVERIDGGEYPGVTSLLIVRHGQLALERYFKGYDGRTELHMQQSVSKSFASAIIGIAIEEGVFSGTDERVLDFFPDHTEIRNRDARKEQITLYDLLTMRSGTDYHEQGSDSPHSQLNRMSTGWTEFYLDRPMINAPGTQFQYDSGAVILSSALIKARTGVHANVYARDRLFGALGISDLQWELNREGHPHMGGGLELRPRDMARFGQLYLNRGRWDGRQVVPEAWVDRSFEKHVDFGEPKYGHIVGYGFWWWMLNSPQGTDSKQLIYTAMGFLGQYIFVVPEYDMVVVATGDSHRQSDQLAPIDFMYSDILPAVMG